HLIQYLQELGHDRCELVFGWHWGLEYPPGRPWETLDVALADLEAEVRRPEDAGLGALGGDDVTIRVPGLACEFLFCHHSDIHLKFAHPSDVADAFAARWSRAGLGVAVREL